MRLDGFHYFSRRHEFQSRNALHEVGDICILWVANNFGWRANLYDPTLPHDGNAIAEPNGLVEIMGDEHGRLAHSRCEFQELILQLAADQGIESAERFIHQQYVRISGEGAGESDPLLHATRQFIRITIAEALKADKAQLLLGDGQALLLRHATQLETESNVVAYRAMRQQRHVLKHHAQFF
jgi:hypothetical protein